MTEMELLTRAKLDQLAPLPDGSRLDWADVCARAGTGEHPNARRKRFVVAVIVVAALGIPAYAIGRAMSGWLGGEPAPKSIVDNFGSYTPHLGFRPDPGKAVRVASDRSFVLYATTNDRGSYCVATTTPDGGICIRPSIAAAPLIAGIMPGDPGRGDARRTILVAGRVNDRNAVGVIFTDLRGDIVTRRLGVGGFFLAAIESAGGQVPCNNGDWTTVFRALDGEGNATVTARITLASRPRGAPSGVLCGWANGPHP
jgi:hypothetical protein